MAGAGSQLGSRSHVWHYAASGFPLPGLLLLGTGHRSHILIHPAHHAPGYVSSIGCLNPAIDLREPASRIKLADSRSRVVAIIEGLKVRLDARFPKDGPIPGAVIVIEGEPTLRPLAPAG